MKQTATEYLFEKLWCIPKDKFAWNYYLNKAKRIEESNLLRYGFKCFWLGVLASIIGTLLGKFI